MQYPAELRELRASAYERRQLGRKVVRRSHLAGLDDYPPERGPELGLLRGLRHEQMTAHAFAFEA